MIGRIVPIVLFVLLGLLLAVGLKIADHKTELPSPLIGKKIPEFSLPALGQPEVIITHDDLIGQPFLINVWASWCPTCRTEHPFVEQLAASGRLRVIGLNYRDEEADALAWLDYFGNPYALNMADVSGRTAIDFGVYAAPESFLVDADGTILFKQVGMLTPEIINQEILPRIQSAGSSQP
jgi:cytochrome c biogenesis protein CcmG/thiol:disulfide interchange protein DsbE